MDPVGLVLATIGKVVQMMDDLKNMSTQAFRLADRIGGLEEPLQSIERSRRPYPEEALRQLLDVIKDSRDVLREIRESTPLWRIRNGRSTGAHLSDLSHRIGEVVQTLEVGVAVKRWEQEDELDRAKDWERLWEELDKICATHERHHKEVMEGFKVSKSPRKY